MSNLRQLLTTAQAAGQLGVTVRTISRYVKRGDLTPAVEAPGGERGRALAFLFDAGDVENLRLRRQIRREAS